MPKVLPKRSVPLIDMTAMVDVAFLLLTFFILTTSFKAEEAAVIKTPSAVNDSMAPNSHSMSISIDSTGRVFIGYADRDTRKKVIEKINEDYKLNLSDKGKLFFELQAEVGIPFAKFGEFFSGTPEEMKKKATRQEGIPYPHLPGTSQENELKRWIIFGVAADKEISRNVNIKADQSTPYPAVKEVMSTLQDWNINRFNLVTEKEEAPTDMIEREKAKAEAKKSEG